MSRMRPEGGLINVVSRSPFVVMQRWFCSRRAARCLHPQWVRNPPPPARVGGISVGGAEESLPAADGRHVRFPSRQRTRRCGSRARPPSRLGARLTLAMGEGILSPASSARHAVCPLFSWARACPRLQGLAGLPWRSLDAHAPGRTHSCTRIYWHTRR